MSRIYMGFTTKRLHTKSHFGARSRPTSTPSGPAAGKGSGRASGLGAPGVLCEAPRPP